MPTIRVNGVELYYESTGSGPQTVVFSHGLLMSADMFREQVRFLSPRYRVVAYDHRGQGRSDLTARAHDMDTLAADADALIEALGLAPCHFAGLSMGGFVALRLGQLLDRSFAALGAPGRRSDGGVFHPTGGFPYLLGQPGGGSSDMRVGHSATGSPLVTLTIEAGVTVKVNLGGRLLMQQALDAGGVGHHPTGSLIALGTTARPITFTSAAAAPAPGDWRAIWFDSAPAASARLDHVRVEYAGGPSYANGYHCDPASAGQSTIEDSAILMFGQPASQFVTNSSIAFSAGDGFGRAWTGSPVDFMAGNAFTSVTGCKQGYPLPMPPASCPSPVPCP